MKHKRDFPNMQYRIVFFIDYKFVVFIYGKHIFNKRFADKRTCPGLLERRAYQILFFLLNCYKIVVFIYCQKLVLKIFSKCSSRSSSGLLNLDIKYVGCKRRLYFSFVVFMDVKYALTTILWSMLL